MNYVKQNYNFLDKINNVHSFEKFSGILKSNLQTVLLRITNFVIFKLLPIIIFVKNMNEESPTKR